jgi:NADH-quinone oxidoreductase subunit C
MEKIHQKISSVLKEKFGESILEIKEFRGELTISIRLDTIVEVCCFLKDDSRFAYKFLTDLFGIDMNIPVNRFGVVYNLYSFANKHRLRLKTFIPEGELKVPTVSNIWRTANWHERETYDMFGIIFEGHPDLRRIYLPEEFEHHPLRKDFPLLGIPGSLPLPKQHQ